MLQTERLLARAYFGRFFESELMPAGLAQAQLVIWGIALLAAPGYLMSFVFAINYGTVSHARLVEAILVHRLLYVTFGMMGLGMVAVFMWEGVFPDRRDVRVLGTLPLGTRTHVIARLGALGVVAAMFCLGMNLPSGVVYGLTLWGNDLAADPIRAVAAHVIAISMGGLFLFFALIAAQAVLLNVFGRRTAHRLALLLQVVFVVVLLQAMLFIPMLGPLMRSVFVGKGQTLVAYLPPTWFLALYDVIAGVARPAPARYALAAIGATLGSAVVATALLAGSYRRLVRIALETIDRSRETQAGLARRVSSALARLLTKDPVRRAIAGFTLRTLSRSRTHLILLATYLGFATAIALPSFVPLILRRGSGLDVPSIAVLSLPLVFNFFALVALRVLLALPTEIKANWIFRLYLADDHMVPAIDGVRVALLVAVVVPIATISGLVATGLWGPGTALQHALFTGAAGVLLVDVLMVGLRKIPFTCTYYPGRWRTRTFFPLYAMAFSTYAYSLAGLEVAILERPRPLAFTFLAITVIIGGLTYVQRRNLQAPPGFTYVEEDPDLVFQGFHLSEGLAAGRPPQR